MKFESNRGGQFHARSLPLGAVHKNEPDNNFGGTFMPTITPISDLRNYGTVLEKVSKGSPVYLTRNGRGVYSIRDMEDEERFQKAEAMIQLLCELNAGIRSAEEEGWISEEDFRAHFRNRGEGKSDL